MVRPGVKPVLKCGGGGLFLPTWVCWKEESRLRREKGAWHGSLKHCAENSGFLLPCHRQPLTFVYKGRTRADSEGVVANVLPSQ